MPLLFTQLFSHDEAVIFTPSRCPPPPPPSPDFVVERVRETGRRKEIGLHGMFLGSSLENSDLESWVIIHQSGYICKWEHPDLFKRVL